MDKGVYIVTGATGGIGTAVVRLLVEQGEKVIAISRDETKAQLLSEQFNISYKILSAIEFEAIDQAFTEIINEHGKIEGVVNCIGSLLLKPAHLTSAQEWQTTLLVNLTSAFAIVRAAGKYMTTGGSVVLVSSAASKIGLPNHEAIAAAKGGINGLMLSAAATYATRNLRFNAVAPGLVETPLTARITNSPTSLAASIANHPLGRIGQPQEIARLIVWLLSAENSWITGQLIAVDGGLSTLRATIRR